MKQFFTLLLIFQFSINSWAGPDFQTISRRAERASWDNAQSWAHYLAVQDLLSTMTTIYFQVASSTIDEQELEVLRQQNAHLSALYDNVVASGSYEGDDLKQYVFDELSKYAQNLQRQFSLTWSPTIQNHSFAQLNDVLAESVNRYKQICEVGRTSAMASTDIPAMRIPSISTNVTISPNLDTIVGISATLSGGNADSDWQKYKGNIQMFTQTAVSAAVSASTSTATAGASAAATSSAAAGSTAAAGGASAAAGAAMGAAALVQMAFLIVDHFISRHELRQMRDEQARAMRGYYERRARNRDIIELYKENCKSLSRGLERFVEIVNSSDSQREELLARSRSAEFSEQFNTWVTNELEIDKAACRANLIQNYLNETCEPANVEARPSKFV
ncbi:MAG: hypothetical protein HRT44_02775, partial [Bdellovibrionales bacterium]|nr:hypothetical protein [Bdellovibrionales bacterium]NQZ18171.1 hypothetical protein [Bdellovibrionales bacterium]